ncbi:beta-ketoacyl-[acyl-carrier-protein] synthase family protein [Geomonas anaerohicana]|uniref:Beta-ketoacyl-[acyl-carrier-protein] synthase family protein n=1 Tax=Geomonas anaerohicana TaxID=2798583 RepID=A0ABS0Y8V1_9BACT|nr:beta-ketoacyl-[acyl-carrier-protein] synthase family protein [Geomonas anaerohicana]MBJ6748726.1 beta-ketoacyl-[acyl-carrier-protein] synthase family protein [Geomonas anaerohicana]
MIEVCITAAQTVTGLGTGLDPLFDGIMAGKSAVAPVERFGTARYLSPNACCVPGLAAGEDSLLYPLLERLMEGFPAVPADCRLLLASTKGPVDLMERLQRGEAVDPAELPMERVLSRVAGRCGTTGPALNVNAACASSTLALARAAQLIALGRCEAALVICLDLVSEFVFSGFSALQALSPTRCRPFDRNRDGLTLGEGGAALLLMSRERARREERKVLGVVAGWGAANDATHITAPARDACGLIQTVRQALARAGLTTDAIAAVSAHGTATPYNDQMEMTALRALFPGRNLPVHSVKGAIGHTLGAAGGIEAALALKCLEAGVLPPTVGLIEPDPEGVGLVSDAAQDIRGDFVLSTNSGFGGVNAAVILGRGDA